MLPEIPEDYLQECYLYFESIPGSYSSALPLQEFLEGEVYFLEANLGIVLFYAFYRLLCVRDTFFVGRRVALLSFVAASFVLPFVGMEWSSFSMTESPVTEYVTTFLMTEVTVGTRGPSAPHPLSAGFLLAMLLFSGVRERLETADIPEFLKGLPITLVAAALVSLSFLGFAGIGG